MPPNFGLTNMESFGIAMPIVSSLNNISEKEHSNLHDYSYAILL